MLVAEASRIDESHSVWGSRFAALGAARTGTVQNRVLLSAPLGGAWRGLVGYERSSAEVSAGGGMLGSISGLRAEGWSAETRGSGVFREGDLVRFSVRRDRGSPAAGLELRSGYALPPFQPGDTRLTLIDAAFSS